MRYFILTLGCQMNRSDAQRLAYLLNSLGLVPSSEEEADLIFVIACSVRQSAVDRIYGKLKDWQKKKVILTGCLLPFDQQKLKDKVSLIFPISELHHLPQLLGQILPSLQFKDWLCAFDHYLQLPPLISGKEKEGYLPIMTGCNHFCTYCAVPYTRGQEVSRDKKEILAEATFLLQKGIKRLILLGQNVNNYKEPGQKEGDFVALLKELVALPFDFQLGFISANPWNFPFELIELIQKEPKLLKEIHLPLQSGDDQVLRRMNRPYTASQYLTLIQKLREHIPQLYLSTDIIVGFPGETEEQFQNTVKVCQKAGFDKAYIAMYSPRPGTVAARWSDDVPLKEKKRRWLILEKIINQPQLKKQARSLTSL